MKKILILLMTSFIIPFTLAKDANTVRSSYGIWNFGDDSVKVSIKGIVAPSINCGRKIDKPTNEITYINGRKLLNDVKNSLGEDTSNETEMKKIYSLISPNKSYLKIGLHYNICGDGYQEFIQLTDQIGLVGIEAPDMVYSIAIKK